MLGLKCNALRNMSRHYFNGKKHHFQLVDGIYAPPLEEQMCDYYVGNLRGRGINHEMKPLQIEELT